MAPSADIDAIINALRAATRQAELLVASQPAAAAACLAHLTATNFPCLAAMRDAARAALHLGRLHRAGPIRPGLPTRWFLSRLETEHYHPPPATGIGAPAALHEFRRSQDAALELLSECRDLDLNSIRFRYPFIRGLRFSLGAGFLIIAAHQRTHLWHHQIDDLSSPGSPSSVGRAPGPGRPVR